MLDIYCNFSTGRLWHTSVTSHPDIEATASAVPFRSMLYEASLTLVVFLASIASLSGLTHNSGALARQDASGFTLRAAS